MIEVDGSKPYQEKNHEEQLATTLQSPCPGDINQSAGFLRLLGNCV